MTTTEIANRLAEMSRTGQFEAAQKELYATDAISIEPVASEMFEKETKGLEKINEKIRKFHDSVETMHSIEVSEPLVAGNSFTLKMALDVTMHGKRMDMQELCLYKVKDGKVISEEFFI
ncbi:MAG: SnoaL-like domain-containing protein [Chitinophagaceae bacterium]